MQKKAINKSELSKFYLKIQAISFLMSNLKHNKEYTMFDKVTIKLPVKFKAMVAVMRSLTRNAITQILLLQSWLLIYSEMM